MIRVLLIHPDRIPHYRIPIYTYLSGYLKQYGFEFIVTSDGIQPDNKSFIDFKYIEMPLSTRSIARLIHEQPIDVIIDFMELKHTYLFPTYFIARFIHGKKMIYWGQGRDLLDAGSSIKNLAYATEQAMCDAIILYAEHLKKYIPKRFHEKTFIANNTLYIDYQGFSPGTTREKVLAEYGIQTKKNIICMGRMQKRKRIDHLAEALASMNRPDIGLILVGPDPEGILDGIRGNTIYKLGPIYGNKRFDLLTASDVYCLPGAVGLSIIDAFHCGLPFVTEDGDESAEIGYLQNGINGFVVRRGDIKDLSEKLTLLIDNDELRRDFSDAARQEIETNGHINAMCRGFRDALHHATGNRKTNG